MADYPEHEKLSAVADKSQEIGEFIEWMASKGRHFMVPGTDECPRCDGGDDECPRCDGTGVITYETLRVLAPGSIQDWLAEFYEIDLNVIEQEKRAMLAAIRGAA